MADYRYILTKVWRDDWFSELPNDGKVLWFYLLTNPAASVCGMFRLSDKFIAFDTGLTQDRVLELKEQFQKDDKIEFEGDIIWVKKMRELNYSASPKIAACILKDIQAIPASEIRDMYLEKYGINSPLIPYLNQTKPNRTKQNLTKPICADAPKRAKRETNPLSAHPAIVAIREITNKFPPESLYQQLIDTLGENPDIEKLKSNRAEWAKRGYNPNAFTWAIDWYKTGITQRQNGNGNKSIQRTASDILADKLKELEANGESN